MSLESVTKRVFKIDEENIIIVTASPDIIIKYNLKTFDIIQNHSKFKKVNWVLLIKERYYLIVGIRNISAYDINTLTELFTINTSC